MDPKNVALIHRTYSVKKRFLGMYRAANAGHIGCSLSCTEMLVFVRFAWMKEMDTLILSKGHAAAALYAVLADAGILSEKEIQTFYTDGTSDSAVFELSPVDATDSRRAVVLLDGLNGTIRTRLVGSPEEAATASDPNDPNNWMPTAGAAYDGNTP